MFKILLEEEDTIFLFVRVTNRRKGGRENNTLI